MADIVKKVNRAVPPQARTLTIRETDAGEGDVIMVQESMGRPAKKILIEAEDEMSVRFNVYHKVFPNRDGIDFMSTAHLPNLALGGTIKDDTSGLIQLAADETFEMDDGFPTSDIELVTCSGNFCITCV